jgi:hypothetical protein
MARTNGDRSSLLFDLRIPKLSKVVVRDVRDRDGHRLGRIVKPHDGTEPGVIAAAQAATERMYTEFSTSSNVQSRICATDSTGNPKWAVSPNFLHLAEVGTEEALYIWGGPGSAVRGEPSYPLCSQKCTGSQEGNPVV